MTTPTRFLPMFQTFADFVAAVLPGMASVWGEQDIERMPLPFVHLIIVDPPTPTGMASRTLQAVPMAVRVVVPNATDEAILFVNGRKVSHVPGPGATVDTIRDALVAEIAGPSFAEPVTAVAGVAPGEFEVRPDGPTAGNLRRVMAGLGWPATVEVLTVEAVRWIRSLKRGRIAFEVYAQDAYAEPGGAIEFADDLQTALMDPDATAVLADVGIVIEGPPTSSRNLSTLLGTEVEARMHFEVQVALFSHRVKPANLIETVEIRSLASGRTLEIVAP